MLRGFIGKFVRNRNFADGENIFESGSINSLFMMQLVLFIEKQFDLVVENDDLELRNFTSIDAMTNLIEGKLARTATAATQ